MNFNNLKVLIANTHAEKSNRRSDYFYADPNYDHGLFVGPFLEELIANLFECKSAEARETLFRHYLNELRLIPNRINDDAILEYYTKSGRVYCKRGLPPGYEKFCEIRLES